MGEVEVSVILITYNQENYIRKALDSILQQKTSFEYEIIIGDDCSTDTTPIIIKEYIRQYGSKIKAVFRKKNIGATRNSAGITSKAKGKYLAFLEGDDYWCDEQKLQIQYDFLEKHLEYCACGHQCIVVDEMEQPIVEKNNKDDRNYWYFSKSEYTIEDFELAKAPGQVNSMFCRNLFTKEDLSFISYAHNMIGDKTMILVLLSKGRIYFMNREMHCYRLIENVGADNWKSMARAKNKRFEEYRYFCTLEEYANTRLGMNIDLSLVKKDKLICASVFLLRHFSIENLYVVFRMIMERGRVRINLCICIKALLIKAFNLYIRGEDKPVVI